VTSIRVLLVDDHTIVRKGLRALLDAASGLEVVDEARDGQEALDMVRGHQPDVVLMDIGLPLLSGLDATRYITCHFPDVRVIVLTIHKDDEYILRALQYGAIGYLLKDIGPTELLKAVQAAYRGERFFSPEVMGAVDGQAGEWPGNLPRAGRYDTLTARERQVLQLVAETHSVQAIAQMLDISEKTVRAHRLRVMEKLGLRSDVELTLYALRKGLTTLDR
jgi:DNA-binding NarL/FixJ family response regulator